MIYIFNKYYFYYNFNSPTKPIITKLKEETSNNYYPSHPFQYSVIYRKWVFIPNCNNLINTTIFSLAALLLACAFYWPLKNGYLGILTYF